MWFLSISHGGFPLKVSIFSHALSMATSSPEIHAPPRNPSRRKDYTKALEFSLTIKTQPILMPPPVT